MLVPTLENSSSLMKNAIAHKPTVTKIIDITRRAHTPKWNMENMLITMPKAGPEQININSKNSDAIVSFHVDITQRTFIDK